MYTGTPPSDMPYEMRPAEHGGISFNRPYPAAAQPGSYVSAMGGRMTDGPVDYTIGLGGPFADAQGFARETSPFSTGVNLRPNPTAVLGANDISRFDPRKWFPSAMTLFHTTRVPGRAESGGY